MLALQPLSVYTSRFVILCDLRRFAAIRLAFAATVLPVPVGRIVYADASRRSGAVLTGALRFAGLRVFTALCVHRSVHRSVCVFTRPSRVFTNRVRCLTASDA